MSFGTKYNNSIQILIVICLLLTISNNIDPIPKIEPEVKGDVLEFNLPDLQGNIVTNVDSTFVGKVVFITIWGTWCPPCRSEIPTFIDLQKKYKDEGLIILAIAFEKNEDILTRQEYLQSFVDEQKINYLVLDGGDTSEFSYALPQIEDVDGLPIEIFISRSGKVVETRNGFGYSESWAQELERNLHNLLAKAN
jgi:thiol-disulfide isomerase/thioredoxin